MLPVEDSAAATEILTDSLLSRRRLMGDTILNCLGQGLPMIVGVVALPFVVHGLGSDRFGLFSLAVAVLGTFGLLDLGMPRATTKFVAERLIQGDMNGLRKTFWTSLLIQTVLGAVSGGLLLALIPWLTSGVLNVPPGLVRETRLALLMIALQVPFVMITSTARGALEAGRHFRTSNVLKLLVGSILYVVPVFALRLGFGLLGILFCIFITRVFFSCLHLFYCIKIWPVLAKFAMDAALFRPLLIFGSGVLIVNVMSTLLLSIDRFLIGAIETIRDVGFYSVPVDGLNRLFIVPTSIVTVLFPTFIALARASDVASSNKFHLSRIFAQSLKCVTLIMVPLTLFLALFARPLLHLWLGPVFAAQSTTVFQIAAVAVLVSSLAWIPTSLLQAVGRPDLPAKLMLVETPFLVGLMWILIRRHGIAGVAFAWLVRAVAEVIWLFWALWRVRPEVFQGLVRARAVRGFSAVAALVAISWVAISAFDSLLSVQLMAFGLTLLVYVGICWRTLLEPSERLFLSSLRSSYQTLWA